MDYDYETEEALQVPKAPRYEGLCYMVRYVAKKPQIAAIKGKKPKKIYLSRNFIEISEEDFNWLVDILRGRPMKTSTDEYLMTRLDQLGTEETSLMRDGKGGSQEILHVRSMAAAIYNDLRARGWVWSERISDWVRNDES